MLSRSRGCFFFNDTATTEIYTLSLHDALPIFGSAVACDGRRDHPRGRGQAALRRVRRPAAVRRGLDQHRPALGAAQHRLRSEEHTSELQSRQYLVCRLLLEKKKTLVSATPSFS